MRAPMDCGAAHAMLPLYVDDELDTGGRDAFERHLAQCAACRQAVETERALKVALRALPRHPAPPGLAARIRSALPAGAMPPPRPPPRTWPRGRWRVAAPALAAGVALFLLGGAVGRWALAPTPHDLAARDVVAAHVRALVGENVTDVASAETHTVKPWFQGRVEVSPAVANLAAEGFPLVGGRVDFVAGRRAATLVYRRRAHIIAVFVWPGAEVARGPATDHGYNLEYWRAAGLNYTAISDLNGKELGEFATLFRGRTAPTGR